MPFEIEISTLKYILIPLISAFIGWMTNWIAIKMLFHPKKPISFGLFTLHGLFYKKQKELANRLATTIEEKLFSTGDIAKVLKTEKFRNGISSVMEKYVDDFIENRLKTIHPMLAMIPEDLINKIRNKLIEEFETFVPKLVGYLEGKMDSDLDIKSLIRSKIENFQVEQLEDILFALLKAEFKHIEYVGGVLGFIIGITQLVIIEFLP